MTGGYVTPEAKQFGHFNSIAYSPCFVSLLIMLRRDTWNLKSTAVELMQFGQHTMRPAGLSGPSRCWISAEGGNIEAGIR